MAQSISQEAIIATGLPGATAASRHAGATSSGAPTSGTFAVGDFVVDQSGAVWICTSAGTPGTWAVAGTPPTAQIAGKNKIINGDFRVAQRGTSLTSGSYTLDQWVQTGTGTSSQQSFTPGAAPVPGYEAPYYYNWTITSNQQNAEMLQRIEDARTFANQTVTLSFWARSTVGAQLENVAIYQDFGTGGSPSSLNPATYLSGSTGAATFTPTSSWVRYTFTFSIPSVSGKTFGTNNNSFLWVRVFQHTATTTNTSIDIWGVQLESGSVATEFNTASGSIGGELALCQRYFYEMSAASPSASSMQYAPAQAVSTTVAEAFVTFPVTMRTTPSLTTSTVSQLGLYNYNGGIFALSAISLNNGSPYNAQLSCTIGSANLTAGYASGLYSDGNNTSYLQFSAEL